MKCRTFSTHVLPLALIVAGFGLRSSAAVVDRVALVVGKTVFTESEVDDEARLSELESGRPLDLSPARRKEAAERLVDQQLLRDEMNATGFQPPASDPEALQRRFRQEHYASMAQYRAALARYGITEEALKQHLVWEVALLRFTDRRFGPLAGAPNNQSANRMENGAQSSDGGAEQATDQAMDAWLKQQRADTRIVFKQEAFQ